MEAPTEETEQLDDIDWVNEVPCTPEDLSEEWEEVTHPKRRANSNRRDFKNKRTDEVCQGLLSLGLEKGDRVGVYSPNRAEWVLAHQACARAGLILVNVNPAF